MAVLLRSMLIACQKARAYPIGTGCISRCEYSSCEEYRFFVLLHHKSRSKLVVFGLFCDAYQKLPNLPHIGRQVGVRRHHTFSYTITNRPAIQLKEPVYGSCSDKFLLCITDDRGILPKQDLEMHGHNVYVLTEPSPNATISRNLQTEEKFETKE